jgi:hypothetical protein
MITQYKIEKAKLNIFIRPSLDSMVSIQIWASFFIISNTRLARMYLLQH